MAILVQCSNPLDKVNQMYLRTRSNLQCNNKFRISSVQWATINVADAEDGDIGHMNVHLPNNQDFAVVVEVVTILEDVDMDDVVDELDNVDKDAIAVISL